MGGLFKTKTVTTTAERLSDFKVNSASYGETVPVIFGTTRISGNIIDWFDFTPIPHTTTTRTGKGGGSKSTNTEYTYTVACLLGLAEGPIAGIGRVWKDKEIYDSPSAFGLTLFTGEYGQAPWTYTQGKYPDKALPYSGLAYVAGVVDLGDSNSLPTLNFELRGILLNTGDGIDANPADTINYISTDAFNGINIGDTIDAAGLDRLRTYAKATDLLISLPPDTNNKAYEIINDFCSALDTAVFLSEDKVKFVPLCMEAITGNGATFTPNTTVLYDLTADDFLPMDDGVLVRMERVPDGKAYNQYTIEFLNRANAYETETVDEQILVDVNKRGLRPADSLTMHFLHTKARASYVARTKSMNSLTRRNRYTFRLDWAFSLLEPGDFLTITDAALGLEKQPVVVDDWEEVDEEEIEITAFGIPRGNYSAGIYDVHETERPSINYLIEPGDTIATVFNPTAEITSTGLEAWIAASGGDNWGGCSIWLSDKNDQYESIGEIIGPSRHGTLTAALPAGNAIDTVNSLKVQLIGNTQLLGGTQEDAQNLNTLCWVDGELIAYAFATLTGAKQYTLTYLVRGVYNTPITTHAAGAKFVRLDRDLFKYTFNKEQIGKTVYLKLAANNVYGIAGQNLDDVEAIAHTLTITLPPNVSGITLDEDTSILKDGTVLSDIIVAFTEPSYTILDHYNVYYDINNSSQWQYAGPAQGSGYKIKSLPNTKTVKVKVCTVSKFGQEAAGAVSAPYTITGKSNPPDNVTSITATQDPANKSNILLAWAPVDAAANPDLKGYEVRVGNTWAVGAKIKPDPIPEAKSNYVVPAGGNYTFHVKALDNSGNYSAAAASVSLTVTVTPNAPANGNITQDPNDRSILIINWAAIVDKDLKEYEVRLGNVWSAGTTITTTKETNCRYKLANGGVYNFMVCSRNVADYVSATLNLSISANLAPANVTGFTIVASQIDRRILNCSWTAVADTDLSHYEIRQGTNWDSATPVAARIKGNFCDIQFAGGSATFLIKAVNVSGNYSDAAASYVVIVTLTPNIPGAGSAISDPQNRLKLAISWGTVTDTDLAGYEVRKGTVWDSAIVLTTTKESSYQYTVPAGGNYTFLIASKTVGGQYSNPRAITATVKQEPGNVATFTAAQYALDRRIINMAWSVVTDTDLAGYEVRKGTVWDSATVIATGIKATKYDYMASVEETATFLVKAITVSGGYSATEKSVSIIIRLMPNAPATGSIIQDQKDKTILVMTWANVTDTDLLQYEVRTGTVWDAGTKVFEGKETSFKYPISANGTYSFIVCSKNVGGYYSTPLNLSIAATINPSDIIVFTATQSISDRSIVTLHWEPPTDLDIAYYEIRQGTNWDYGAVVGTRLTGQNCEIRVLDESEHTYYIKAVSIAGNYSQNAAEVPGIFNLNPDPVSNIQISQNPNERSQLIITWTGITESDLAYYDVRIGYEWDTATQIAKTKETRWLYQIDDTDDTKVMIKAKNAAGFYSDEVFAHYYATVEPGPVTGFVAIQNGEYVELYWNKHSEPDVVSYEIAEGASFDMGQLVATGVTTTEYSVKVDTERQYQYHIKAINRALKYSQNAASYGLYVANLPVKNIIQEYDEIVLQTGTKTNVEFGPSLLNFQTFGGRWSDYPTTKFSDVGGQTVLKLAKNGSIYYASGIYQAVTKDLGQIITANITCDFRSTVVLRGLGAAVLQIRTSQDGINWTAWQDFKPAQYTFRYLGARVVLATEDTSKTPEVNHLAIRIDVPDTDKTGSVTIPIGGATVSYGHTYYELPVLTPMALGDNRFPVILLKTKSSFTAKITDRSGSDTGGTLDWRSKGY